MIISKGRLYLGSDPLTNAKLLLPNKPIYSFFVRRNEQYELIYYVSNEDRYNTLQVTDVLSMLSNLSTKTTGIICFGQPSIEVIVEVFDPYMTKIASDIKKKFPSYEFDDLLQECRLCAVTLYNKGYYLNKSLIFSSFRNQIVDDLRRHGKLKHDCEILSLQDVVISGITNEAFTWQDVIEDPEFVNEYEQKMHALSINDMYDEVKQYIVQSMGERGFEQLSREINSECMSKWGRRWKNLLCKRMAADGITSQYLFDKHYWR